MTHELAQGLIFTPWSGTGSTAPILITGPLKGINNLGDLINKIYFFLLPLSSIILFLVIIWGGYDILMSQGETEKIKKGQQKITTGIIGFALLILSYLLAKLLAQIFGLGGGVL